MANQSNQTFDVAIVGATPGGLMAGVAAARRDLEVVVLERSDHIGGLPANGLGATDIATRGATAGLFQEFVDCIQDHYVSEYGSDSQQANLCDDGYHFEPSAAEAVFEELIDEADIDVHTERQFDSRPGNVVLEGDRLRAIDVTRRKDQKTERYQASVFVDGTYEGDLAAASGAPFQVGRESQDEYDEPFAGRIYKQVAGPVCEGSTGEADNAVQAYNYRLCLTDDPDNKVPIQKPDGYDREEYASLAEDIKQGHHTDARSDEEPEGIEWILLQTPLPNRKTDANNHGRSFVSTDLPEENWPWPTGSWEWRDRFAERLREYTLGLLWFAQNDPELPEEFKEQTCKWGLAADEYADNDHFPRQVYVREGRRVEGEYFFTAHDARPDVRGNRPPIHPTSVTAAHYPIDSHAVRKREPGQANLDGFLSGIETEPYTVPYGVMVPQEVDGLLTPVPVSGTHLGFSTLRMEPCWMALGHAAGTAAALSIDREVPLRDISIPTLQRELVDDRGVLIYYEDLSFEHNQYEAAQLLGARGYLRDWKAKLDEPIDEETVERWTVRSRLDRRLPFDRGETTRGEYLDRLYDYLRDREALEIDDTDPVS